MFHLVESFVDIGQRLTMCDELINFEFASHVIVNEIWYQIASDEVGDAYPFPTIEIGPDGTAIESKTKRYIRMEVHDHTCGAPRIFSTTLSQTSKALYRDFSMM